MKRSEMIDFIQQELAEIMEGPKGNDKMEKYLKRKAAGLLDMIEGFGMIPPVYEGLMANGEKFNKATDSGRDTSRFLDWEPEDKGDF